MTFPQPARRIEQDGRSARHRRPLARTLSLSRLLLLAGLCSASVVVAQAGAGTSTVPGDDLTETEAGIPVTDRLTLQKCGTCHTPDGKGDLSRISWVRTTPEGWMMAIKRMVRLNGLQITPDETRAVVKYLSGAHGLSPEEAKPVMYMPEHRIIDEAAIPNDAVRGGCASCHAFGQPLSWRRSKTEWRLLQNLHVALYSQADAQFRRPAPLDGAGAGTGPGTMPATPAQAGTPPVTQGRIAIDYMMKAAPLHTADWDAWQPRIRTPQLAGKWVVTASVPGKGIYVGEMTVAPGTAPDAFKTSAALHSLRDGTALTRTGTGIVYGGYAWRGRSAGAGAVGDAPDALGHETREALWFSPDQQKAEGRWFWGDYQEFGFDVKLTRATGSPTLAAVSPGALRAGSTGAVLTILGADLPTRITPAEIDLGPGISVRRVTEASPNRIVVSADVASTVTAGLHDVALRGATLEKAFPVYRKVDYLKVTPETSLARLGGTRYPKGFQQYEAFGFDNGADGKPGTADDVPVGPVEATWHVEEFMSVFYDDDKAFVGTLSPAALFTPGLEGPNPARRFGRNNYGEVWVVATAKTEKDAFGKPLTARSYLVVTVPLYRRWDQPEVSQ